MRASTLQHKDIVSFCSCVRLHRAFHVIFELDKVGRCASIFVPSFPLRAGPREVASFLSGNMLPLKLYVSSKNQIFKMNNQREFAERVSEVSYQAQCQNEFATRVVMRVFNESFHESFHGKCSKRVIKEIARSELSKSLLIEKRYWRFASSSTQPARCFAELRPGLDLNRRKDAWTHYQAWASWGKTSRHHKYEGIVVQHFAFDRAQFDKLMRIIQGYFMPAARTSWNWSDDWYAMWYRQWVVGTPCATHDGNNGGKWGLFVYMDNRPLLKDTFVFISS